MKGFFDLTEWFSTILNKQTIHQSDYFTILLKAKSQNINLPIHRIQLNIFQEVN